MGSRRDFFRSGGCFALALAAALALTEEGRALPIRLVDSLGSRDDLLQYPIPSQDGVHVDWKNQVILARYQGALYAFSLACPHQQAAVEWIAKDQNFVCTKHHSHYTPAGVYVSGRATRNLDRFAITRHSAVQLSVDLNHWFRSDQQPAAWAAAVIKL